MNKNTRVIIATTIDVSINSYNYKNTPLGHRYYVDQRMSYKIKKTFVEWGTQPLNDGTVKYGPWKEEKEKFKKRKN